MTESTPETTVNVSGDAVVNQAPDGGGVDNNLSAAADPQPEGASTKTQPGDTETSV